MRRDDGDVVTDDRDAATYDRNVVTDYGAAGDVVGDAAGDVEPGGVEFGDAGGDLEAGGVLLEDVGVGALVGVERLGVGRRVETWLAWSVRYWCPVVAKVGRAGHREAERTRRSLRREVAALDTRHPALPRLVADGTDSVRPYVVLEYVDGPDLAEAIDETGSLEAVDVALLGAQLLPALMDLHRRGLAHLDVKPENVVLRDGRPVLVDFGSARAIGSPQPAGRPVGTEGYASPELEACEPVSVAMDLYGLGTVLAEALTGVPFPDGEPLPRTTVTGLVERLLSPAPDDRGQAGDVLDQLARCCGDRRPWPEWLDRHLTAAG